MEIPEIPVAIPIAAMGLMEAKRSLLMQIQAERELSARLRVMHVPHMKDDEVNSHVREFLVMHENVLQTVEHIQDMEARTGA